MKRKSPWLAALLNVLLPGLGFIYIGKALYITSGILLILISVIDALLLFEIESTFKNIVMVAFSSILWAIALAIIGYEAAKQVNLNITGRSKYCISCGARNEIDADYCIKCKQKFISVEPPAVNPKIESNMFCTHCGFKNPFDSIYCIKCGDKLKK